ncbi:hypothetical protein NPIL_541821 [Nephila pilipes]|uniref:Uncharacterized protein n=1 Tax=Nephila pilipes TaxID=299642 RepID=A0A8X6MRB1_NEPPI|nr:hypothetical protein NPIL_182671 [Nephila pilipes]GFS73509.1 hypothetical protein NPIL_466301 [Nephila pilipes]GFS85382.1 hypothetical protein NPIL_381081 [Nephila pilipes]GFS93791.1 hypothetical protein NPIL_541821 [Nephila pilipes]
MYRYSKFSLQYVFDTKVMLAQMPTLYLIKNCYTDRMEGILLSLDAPDFRTVKFCLLAHITTNDLMNLPSTRPEMGKEQPVGHT